MVRQIDAIYTHGAFRPLEPLALPEGTRVHLSVEADADSNPARSVFMIRSPKLANRKDAVDFVMEVRSIDDAGL